MAREASKFESSEALATMVASTPLLEETWRRCSRANATAQRSFTVDRAAEIAYVAFSGVQTVEMSSGEKCVDTIFGEEASRIHGGLLQLFVSFCSSHVFQNEIQEAVSVCKSVIFTGHSLGGAVASLAALWLLSNIQRASSTPTVFCITYGSPMLGNQRFSRAILQERWAGNFCHVVGRYDLLPRLLFAPLRSFASQLQNLFQIWHLSMTSANTARLVFQIPQETKDELFDKVFDCIGSLSRGGEDQEESSFWPFGSYMFCTENGSICVDNAAAAVKLLYLTMANGSGSSCIEDHLNYEYYVDRVSWLSINKPRFPDMCFSESSDDADIASALLSLGLTPQEAGYREAQGCLARARQLGCKRNLNNAKMAVALAKITPLRAQIEWYKASCDDSDDKSGYYDSFKLRGASKKGSKINLNRIKLGQFWDELIQKLETNKLTPDFHKLIKYVNASQFYKLLVEPLEIAEYYRSGEHMKRGHYIEYGREKRFKIFDKWWRERTFGDEENNPRSKFASLTQDSCFWARVEEARDCIYKARGQIDAGMRSLLLGKIEKFEQYAGEMVNRKEVSVDVLAENSSYNLFRGEWKELQSHLQLMSTQFPGFQDGMVQ